MPGETYYVVVGGYCGSGGTFDLLIEKSDCLLNDRCEGATPVIVDEQISNASSMARSCFNCWIMGNTANANRCAVKCGVDANM